MSRSFRVALAALAALALCSCERTQVDPPLPPPKFEVAPAPPGALGAKAAGTDAAPPPPQEEPNAWPSDDEQAAPQLPSPPKPADGGAAAQPDAGGLPL